LPVAAGELHLDLHGEKLRGRFVLVRTKTDSSGEEEWLTLHKHDEYAVGVVHPHQVGAWRADSHGVELSGSMRRWTRVLGPLGRETRLFARALGGRQGPSTGLLVVGVPEFEPWHFTAHLGEGALRYGRADLAPTLLRWKVPLGAPPHLAVTVDAMAKAARDQTILVIDPCGGSSELLERVADARRCGARIMTLHRGHDALMGLSHETLSVDRLRPARDFEITQHLVTDLTPVAPALPKS